MSYRILRGVCALSKTDAIVNVANPKPVCSPGTEMELYREAGFEQMLALREEKGELKPGDTFITPGFSLPAKQVIHIVLPKWIDGLQNEASQIRACYRTVFREAAELKVNSLSVPVFGMNMHRVPPKRAMDIAIDETSAFLLYSSMAVQLVLENDDTFELPSSLSGEINAILEQKTNPVSFNEIKSIEDAVTKRAESFGDRFFRLVDEKGFTDSDVYNRANIHRRIISKLRTEPDKGVSKDTALSLAIALHLTLDETREFIGLAGWALSDSSTFDRIIQYFLERRRYNLTEINEALFVYCGRSLGE